MIPNQKKPLIIAATVAAVAFGTANAGQQPNDGQPQRFRHWARAFGSGALAGGLLALGGTAVRHTPIACTVRRGAGATYGTALAVALAVGVGRGLWHRDWRVLGNARQILLGGCYLDEHRSFFGQTWQGISRFSWELPQTTIGHAYVQWRNIVGGVDRIKHLGGATFSIGTGRRVRHGVSLGHHIGLSLHAHDADVARDPLCLHEYGHTFQSQRWGPLYLLVVGLPSLFSAATARPIGRGLTSHSLRWYEQQANRYAAQYAATHYGIDWSRHEPPLGCFPTGQTT